MAIATIDPVTGTTIETFCEMDPARIDGIVREAHDRSRTWRTTPIDRRAVFVRNAGRALLESRDELALLMAEEMGKPVTEGRAEIEKCTRACDHYAEHAERYLTREDVATQHTRAYVVFEPLGVVLGVMPWNFPFWQVFRFAVPAIMAGNVALLKHASNVPRVALAIERVFAAASFPPGVFQTLIVGNARVRDLVEHPLVAAVTLTGSSAAGAAVAADAGRMIKKTVLELGGSDPYLVLDDADLDRAAAVCAAARLVNAGQSCIAGKRFIVVEQVAEAFLSRFVDAMRSKRVGDPKDEATEIGPLARHDLRDALHRQVEESVARGATLVLGGKVPAGPGAFYPPTVLTHVRPGMPVYDDEVFGPVAAVLVARDEDDAVRIANDSRFGLGAAVFTEKRARGEAVARQLDAGAVFVNAQVVSDPRLPFGGIKASGYGRELGALGIKEFVNAKTIVVA
ncbi:MAG TPA: NAD-dependent succinate-semialdehyde dehydrogenase [Candidatus Polarisedimenticolaceae bacterium]|nr:NAD-dependent succinate-semialdehyde dehydrogenase [Candidatus Polarisedimenticolaceae bacterium]